MLGRWAGISLAMFAIYFTGGLSERHDIFPWPQLTTIKQKFKGTQRFQESRYEWDKDGRLVGDETKTPVPCPKQTEQTAVLLVLGQSNAANHAGQRYRSEHGDGVIGLFGGKCFIAASPLLGSTDARGEYWTRLGNLLVASDRVDRVVIAPLALSGSDVKRWARGGDINALLIETAVQVREAGYRVTDVLWDQGEIDYVMGTSSDAYRQRFLSMVDSLREQKISAPVYVSVASKCLEPSNGGFKTNALDNSIVRAQLTLPDSEKSIRLGVSTDALLDDIDRYDDCHIAETGAEKVARAWADLLLADRPQSSGTKNGPARFNPVSTGP